MSPSVPRVCVAKNLRKATTFAARLRGLLGDRSLSDDDAMWINPCSSVHTIGMRFPIDIVFVDRAYKIKRLATNTPAGRIRFGPRGTQSVVELPAGRAAACGLRINDQLMIDTSLIVEKTQ